MTPREIAGVFHRGGEIAPLLHRMWRLESRLGSAPRVKVKPIVATCHGMVSDLKENARARLVAVRKAALG